MNLKNQNLNDSRKILKATELFPHSTDLWLRINSSRNIRDNPLEQVYESALNHNPTFQDLWNSYVSWILHKMLIFFMQSRMKRRQILKPSINNDSLLGLLPNLHHHQKTRCKGTNTSFQCQVDLE
ncbi:hypothetical protein Glove_97g58 [Diversispora epigaea]|uniref:Uncharacterized protein n=1 Tax=Diversispora epigaea TaxID=1348612 RepID=A0A397JF74_9GLOM|nr:hypothetical protein Glove_97g58 [Diversispora epigaea]